jgi:hypothetical protein
MNNVLGSCGVHIPITVTQEQVTYYATPHMKDFTKEKYVRWYHRKGHPKLRSLSIRIPLLLLVTSNDACWIVAILSYTQVQ